MNMTLQICFPSFTVATKRKKVTSETHFSREEVTWNTGNHT